MKKILVVAVSIVVAAAVLVFLSDSPSPPGFPLPELPEPTGREWVDMDYGPFLTASIEAPRPEGNIAYKGIALKMDKVYGPPSSEALIFDTDLLRYSVGWKGEVPADRVQDTFEERSWNDFIDLKGVVFDGTHQTHPEIKGEPIFANPKAPGWARAGSFEDPRELPYGPLPRSWAHYKGLYLYENRVIFSYTVGDTAVLEMPGLEFGRRISSVFTRTINTDAANDDLVVQITTVNGAEGSLVAVENLEERDPDDPAASTLAVMSTDVGTTAAAAVGVPSGSRWQLSSDGDIRLRIPASEAPTQLKVLLWAGDSSTLPDFAAVAVASPEPDDLTPMTRGSARRWRQNLTTAGEISDPDEPYVIDTLNWPDDNPWRSWMRFGGFDFFEDPSRAAICTWNGDVWLVNGIAGSLEELTWQRIATGLFQPLGLKIVDDQIYVLGRDQITILRDLNGDGETDFYENFNNDHQVTEHFHEFAMDLQVGLDGAFYYMKGGRHALDSVIPQHGTLVRVARDGSESEIVANGFRAPNGLGIAHDGRFFSSDQQGHWVPANRINVVQPGGFYGYMWSFHEDERPTGYDEPLAWIHPSIDRSPSTFVSVDSDRWGPFENRLISLSYGMGKVDLVLEEEVDGNAQGGLARFPLDFETGVMRGRFHPIDGQLYVAGLYGWAGNKTRPGGFYRIRYTGKPAHMPARLETARDGVVITFTQPLNDDSALDVGNYHVQAWNYRWTETYGSPDLNLSGEEGRETLGIGSAALSEDRRSVFLELPDITPVMQLHVDLNLRAQDGSPIRSFVHATLHRIGVESGLDKLGEGWIAGRDLSPPTLVRQAPGLIQEIRSKASVTVEADARRSRMAALYVPSGESPSRRLPGGPFQSRWRGYLQSDLNQVVTFHLGGRGEASLRINGAVVLEAAGNLGDSASSEFPIRSGLNTLELNYESPPDGNADVRLEWSSRDWPREPVPPSALVHAPDDPALEESGIFRKGMKLFTDSRCINCHHPERPLPEGSDPKLGSKAASLDGVGERLKRAWLTNWSTHPPSADVRSLAPGLLPRNGSQARSAAADISAFLVGPNPRAADSPRIDPSLSQEGKRLFDALGCAGCHHVSSTPGETPLIGLSSVREKWRFEGLVEYLLEPERADPWARMPNFDLNRTEAQALAGFLFNTSMRPAEEGPSAPGDAARGRRLLTSSGCLNCHDFEGEKTRLEAPALSDLVGQAWATGCLAVDDGDESRSPRFSFTAEERAALRSFLKGDLSALRRSDWIEFAESSIQDLQCVSCHERDSRPPRWSPQGLAAAPGVLPDQATIHQSTPPLTWAGEKLRPEWTLSLISGALAGKARPRLETRMPSFPAYASGIARGLAQAHGVPPISPNREPIDTDAAAVGNALIETGELGCIQCHPDGSRPNLAGPDTETLNLDLISSRLRRQFYDRFMRDPQRILPGTMMPAFMDREGRTGVSSHWQGDGVKQSEAIWEYLRSRGER